MIGVRGKAGGPWGWVRGGGSEENRKGGERKRIHRHVRGLIGASRLKERGD